MENTMTDHEIAQAVRDYFLAGSMRCEMLMYEPSYVGNEVAWDAWKKEYDAFCMMEKDAWESLTPVREAMEAIASGWDKE